MDEEKTSDEAAKAECSHPPAAVRAVEVFAKTCRALVLALACIALIASVFSGVIGFVLMPILVLAGIALFLGSGMVECVRNGHFAWFWIPNFAIGAWCVWVSYIALYVGAAKEGTVSIALVSAIVVMSILAIVPAALLLLPSSRRWAAEARSYRRKGHPRLRVVAGLCCLLVLLGMVLPSTSFFENCTLCRELREARELHNLMLQNYSLRASGSGWIDPASCQDSRQFVQRLLGDKAERSLMAQSWCIAVNPPDDDGFPVILVDGIVIDLMLDPKNGLQSVVWIPGERRPTFSEPMVVLRNGQVKFVHAETRKAQGGGVYSVERRKKTPLELFDGRVPRPAPDTYFLTPTGRLEIEIAEQPGTDPEKPL